MPKRSASSQITDWVTCRYEDSFFEKAVTPDVQEIRWKHYETKRLEKLSMVREERQVPLAPPGESAPDCNVLRVCVSSIARNSGLTAWLCG